MFFEGWFLMSKDIRVALSFFNHHKTKRLHLMFGDSGIVALMKLWAYCAEHCPTGEVSRFDEIEWKLATGLDENCLEFVEALCSPAISFVDVKNSNKYIHDWEEHNGWVFHSSTRKKIAQKAASAKWGSTGSKNKLNRSQRMSDAKKKGNHSQIEWEEMRDFFKICVKCCGDSGLTELDRDHIIPLYKGGSHGLDNIQPLCAKCNSSKGWDTTDYRLIFCTSRNIKMPAKWVRSAGVNCNETPAPSPSPIPSPIPSPKSKALSGKPDEIPYQEIIEYLNTKTGKSYRATSADTREHIAARWKEGATLAEFKKAIDNMTAKWMKDPEMCQYLRPATLFARGKFDGYVNQVLSKKVSEGVFL